MTPIHLYYMEDTWHEPAVAICLSCHFNLFLLLQGSFFGGLFSLVLFYCWCCALESFYFIACLSVILLHVLMILQGYLFHLGFISVQLRNNELNIGLFIRIKAATDLFVSGLEIFIHFLLVDF